MLDFLTRDVPGGPFQFVFDRGCFHTFDDAGAQARFASRVAALLPTGGMWLSVIGSTEGPPRDTGPPRRSARDIIDAIEPSLELVLLRAIELDSLLTPPPPGLAQPVAPPRHASTAVDGRLEAPACIMAIRPDDQRRSTIDRVADKAPVRGR